MTFRGYLMAMDVAMRERAPAAALRFDARRARWTLADREVHATDMGAVGVVFQLFTTNGVPVPAGSYSGKIGATPHEVAQYLVYFLETGKPWHHGLAKGGLI